MIAKEMQMLQANRRTVIELAVLIVFLVYAWFVNLPQATAPVNTYVLAQKAPELKVIPHETLACKNITVYVKEAKQALELPPDVVANKDEFVLDASKIA